MQYDNKPPRPNMKKRVRLLLLAIFTLTLAAGTGFFYYTHNRPVISKDIISKVDFKIYVPTENNPAILDKKSVQYIEAEKVLTYSLLLPSGKNIAVSQMLKPVDVEVNPEIKTPINLPTYQKEFKTGYGNARFDIWGDKRVISMLTIDNTWVVLNYTGLDQETAQKVASYLERL